MTDAQIHFLPKIVTVLREGYTVRRFGTDVLAGLTVAIVALPLSMGIAIASGTSPDRGLFKAISAPVMRSLARHGVMTASANVTSAASITDALKL